MINFLKIEDFDLSDKVVGLRVDINSPIIDQKVVLNERIREHSKTIKFLSDLGAKVVVLAHQGRKGRNDCVSLKFHKKLIENEIGKNIKFLDSINFKDVKVRVSKLKSGDILLLENLRFFDDETDLSKKDNQIVKFSKIFNYYILDAFSIAHRSQASIVGIKNIPILAGKVMEKELLGLNRILELKKPITYILGGAKPDDLIEIINKNIDSIDYLVLTGIIGELSLIAKGYNLGAKSKFIKEKGYDVVLSDIKKIINKYKDKVILPIDFVVKVNGKRKVIPLKEIKSFQSLLNECLIFDIGDKSLSQIKKIIDISETIYFKGPPGNFEEKVFEKGTKVLIKYLSKSNSFRFLGGGHTVTAVERFSDKSKFSYVSLAGGALVKFLSKEVLPGLEVLSESYKKYVSFIKESLEYIVIGSNVVESYIECPEYLNHIRVGDKIVVKERFKDSVGGGGINVSICLKRLGANVYYLGKYSNETYNDVINYLKKERVPIIETSITKKASARSVIIDTKDKDRIIFCYRGQNSFLKFEDIKKDDLLKSCKFLYLTALKGDSFETMIRVAKFVKSRKDSFVCINVSMNLIESNLNLSRLFKFCDIVVLNYEEAQALTGLESVSDCLREICKKVKISVITDGAHGAYAYDGSKEYFVRAVKPKKVLDTTGAGDCFAGTFFYFYTQNYGLEKSLMFAAKNASSVVENKGAHKGLLYFSDLIS